MMSRRRIPMLQSAYLPLVSSVAISACVCVADVLPSQANGDVETSGAEPPLTVRERIGLTALKASSGRFHIISASTVTNYFVMKWAEDLADRYERVTTTRVDTGPGAIRIAVRAQGAHGGRIGIEQIASGVQMMQRLVITNMSQVDQESAREALCYLFLSREIRVRAHGRSAEPASVPYWLSEGISQNLHTDLRSRNRDLVLDRWQRGEMRLLPEEVRLDQARLAVVQEESGHLATDLDYRALCGVFCSWMLALDKETHVLDRIVDRLAGGRTTSAQWLAACVPEADTVLGLDTAWDDWLLRQKRIVDRPGETTLGVVVRLRAALLLYPGDSGIPVRNGGFQRMGFHELIEERGGAWIPAFCASKSIELQVLEVGRGEDFKTVVEAYCLFLEALAQGDRSEKRALEMLLNRAEALRASLEESLPGDEDSPVGRPDR